MDHVGTAVFFFPNWLQVYLYLLCLRAYKMHPSPWHPNAPYAKSIDKNIHTCAYAFFLSVGKCKDILMEDRVLA